MVIYIVFKVPFLTRFKDTVNYILKILLEQSNVVFTHRMSDETGEVDLFEKVPRD